MVWVPSWLGKSWSRRSGARGAGVIDRCGCERERSYQRFGVLREWRFWGRGRARCCRRGMGWIPNWSHCLRNRESTGLRTSAELSTNRHVDRIAVWRRGYTRSCWRCVGSVPSGWGSSSGRRSWSPCNRGGAGRVFLIQVPRFCFANLFARCCSARLVFARRTPPILQSPARPICWWVHVCPGA